MVLCSLKQLFDVFDRLVLSDAIAHNPPSNTIRAQEIDLRVGNHYCCSREIEFHVTRRQAWLVRLRIGILLGTECAAQKKRHKNGKTVNGAC